MKANNAVSAVTDNPRVPTRVDNTGALVPPGPIGFVNARDTVPELPWKWLRPFWNRLWTVFYGVAKVGEKPPRYVSNVSAIVGTGVRIAVGMALATTLLGWFCAPHPTGDAWLWLKFPAAVYAFAVSVFCLIAGGFRASVTTLVHEATHGKLLFSRKHGDFLAHLITAFLGTQPFPVYKVEHLQHHAASIFATLKDADCYLFVAVLGFRPGRKPAYYWRRFWLAIFDLRFIFIFNRGRLMLNLFASETPVGRRALAWGFMLGRLAVVAAWSVLSESWFPWAAYLACWIVPMWILYPISALVQFSSEHFWLSQRELGEKAKVFLQRRLLNRFPFTPWPKKLRNVPGYLIRFLLNDVFLRGYVLVASLLLHGRHHLHPGEAPDVWPLEAYNAAEEYARGAADLPPTFDSILVPMRSLFAMLASLPPLTEEDLQPHEADKLVLEM